MFVFQADPPDPAKIPVADVVGVTVVLLTCSYRYIILNKIYYSSEVSLQQLKASISVGISKKDKIDCEFQDDFHFGNFI
jgi:hypothetical protein